MSPLYHLQVGSFIANAGVDNQRDRRLVMLAALAPDADGLFFWNAGLWERFHHTFGHSVFFALMVAAVVAALAQGGKWRVGLLAFFSAILQVFIDQLTNDPSWRIPYLWPVSNFDFALGNFIGWPGLAFLQVKVVQGVLMVAIFAGTVWLYRRTGRTFLEFFSPRLDQLLTNFIVLPFSARCTVCGQRASYRLTEGGQPVCGVHGQPRPNLTVLPRSKPEKQHD